MNCLVCSQPVEEGRRHGESPTEEGTVRNAEQIAGTALG